jgi:MFS family permease
MLSFCSIMMFSIMPLVVTAIERRYGFRESQAGDVVGCYFGGVTVVSFTTFAWIHRFDWRTAALIGQGIAFLALFGLVVANDIVQLSVLMGVAGVGCGITFAVVFTLLGESKNPDRAFAINTLFQAVFSTIMIILLPMFSMNDAKDMRLLSVVMGATALLISSAVIWLPRSGQKGTHSPLAATKQLGQAAIWLPLLGTIVTFLFVMSYTAPWVFIEQAGTAKGLNPVFIGFALAGAQFASILGSVVAAAISNRFGELRPVFIAVAVYCVGIYLLGIFHGRLMFGSGAFLFFLPANFLIAFSLGLTAEVDIGGRVIGLSTASLLSPSLVAPSIAGRLFERHGFASNLWMGAISVLTGLGLYAWLLFIARGWAFRGAHSLSNASERDLPDVV